LFIFRDNSVRKYEKAAAKEKRAKSGIESTDESSDASDDKEVSISDDNDSLLQDEEIDPEVTDQRYLM
jgi:hypothetical protein